MHVYCVPTSIVSCAHTSSTECAIVRLISTTVQLHSVPVCVIYVSRTDVQPNTSHSITCAVAISLVCLEHRVNIVSLTALCCPCACTCVLNHCPHTHLGPYTLTHTTYILRQPCRPTMARSMEIMPTMTHMVVLTSKLMMIPTAFREGRR